MARLLTALVGACVITVLLLFAMNEVVSKFRERDGTRYFLVDFIEPVETGRQRVQRLKVPEAAAGRPGPDLEGVDPDVTVERPEVRDEVIIPGPSTAPELDPSTVERDKR